MKKSFCMKVLGLAVLSGIQVSNVWAQSGTITTGKLSLESRQKVSIHLDYKVQKSSALSEEFQETAESVVIHVSAPQLEKQDQLRVIVNTYAIDSSFIEASQSLDLSWNSVEGDYVGAVPGPITLADDFADEGGTPNRVTLSLVVNGQWQSNPLPDSQNKVPESEFDLNF